MTCSISDPISNHDAHIVQSQKEHWHDVHKHVAKAQHGSRSKFMQFVGTHLTLSRCHKCSTTCWLGYSNQMAVLPTFQAGYMVPQPDWLQHTFLRPGIQLPGQGSGHNQLFSPNPPLTAIASGYTTNHGSYHVTHQKLASKAYATHSGHVIVVEVHVVHMPIGKLKSMLIRVSCIHSVLLILSLTLILGCPDCSW